MHTKVGWRWSQSKRGKSPLYCNYRHERVVPFIFFFSAISYFRRCFCLSPFGFNLSAFPSGADLLRFGGFRSLRFSSSAASASASACLSGSSWSRVCHSASALSIPPPPLRLPLHRSSFLTFPPCEIPDLCTHQKTETAACKWPSLHSYDRPFIG